MFALLAMEWTQNTEDATDKTGFKCEEEVQACLARDTFLDRAFRSRI